MSVTGFLSGLMSPVNKIIDKFTSDKERLEAQRALLQLEVQLSERMLQYETGLMDARAKAITAEAAGKGWLQSNWRPVTMITFLVLVVLDSVDLLPNRLSEHAWDLLELGLGGYVIGRSAEKVVPRLLDAVKKDKRDKD